jgi:hypothetical protein
MVVSVTRVPAVRFELVDRVFSMPAASLKSWESLSGTDEKIVIHAASGKVTVIGRGLEAVHDALDNGRLQVLRESPGASAALHDGPVILAIKLDLK